MAWFLKQGLLCLLGSLLGGKDQLQNLYQFWEIILFPGRIFNIVDVSEGLGVFSIFLK